MSYLNQYPKGTFILTKPLFKPWLPAEIKEKEEIFLKRLKNAGFIVWDSSEDEKKMGYNSQELNKWYIPNDGHPSKINYYEHSKILLKKLKEIDSEF